LCERDDDGGDVDGGVDDGDDTDGDVVDGDTDGEVHTAGGVVAVLEECSCRRWLKSSLKVLESL
jgi:hypothetical protein